MSATPRKRLPLRPSIEHLKKQAKRCTKVEPELTLIDAQHRLAQEYGCRTWPELMELVEAINRNAGVPLMSSSGKPNQPMQAAARAKDMETVRRLLEAGQFTQEELNEGLAGALWYGDAATQWPMMRAIADLLVEQGADPDAFLTTYGPIVFGTGECLVPESLQYLIDIGADVTFGMVDTKYGKQCPLSYWLGTYARGHNERKHRGIEILLKHGAFMPPGVTPAVLAIHRGRAEELAEMIEREPELPRRTFGDMPYGNIELAGATLLHCAVEFEELECVDVLLDRWFDCNPHAEVIEGVGGQTPIYHAIANDGGHRGSRTALQHLVKRLSYSIDTAVRATFRRYGEVHAQAVTPVEFAQELAAEAKEGKGRQRAEEAVALVKSVVWTPSDLAAGRAVIAQTQEPRKELERACAAGDFEAVKRIAASGRVPAGELHHGIGACMPRHVEIARYLLAQGADINADCVPGYGSLLVGACEGLNDEQVKYLLELGADAVRDPERVTKYPDANTPLRMAMNTYVRGRVHAKHQIIEMLVERGARADDALLLAVHRGDVETLGKMLDAEPGLLKKRFAGLSNTEGLAALRGVTLLHVAVEQQERGCCEELFKRYADINATAEVIDGVGGQTAVFQAARSWQGTGYPMLQYLVARVGNWMDTSIKAKVREGERIVEQTVMEYAGERERKLLEPVHRRTLIKQAMLRGDVAEVARLLDAHAELLSPDLWPTAIYQAKSLVITRLLLARGLDPNQCSAPRRPLHLAAYQVLPEIVEALIGGGADVNQVNPLEERPLDVLAVYPAKQRMPPDADVRRVRDLLVTAGAKYEPVHVEALRPFDEYRAPAPAPGSSGNDAERSRLKAFAEALYREGGDLEAVGKLLDAHPELLEARPWEPRWSGTALEAVSGMCVWHRPKAVALAALLIARGARCDLPTAARCGHVGEVTRQLEENPALLDVPDGKGRTALYRATCVYGSFPEGEKVADLLIARGARVDVYSASTLGLVERVRELLTAEPGLARAVDPEGMTALHWAVRARRNDPQNPQHAVVIATMLLDAGADVEAANQQEEGMHPLHHCGEWMSTPAMVDLLLTRGAQINARAEKNGWTPLDYAVSRSRQPMVEHLRSRGGKTREELGG